MLIDQINEPLEFKYPGGLRRDDVIAPLRARAAKASVFVLDRDAVAMAAHVAFGKPSSIIQALPWVKLPFESTWIEFANNDLREAMAELGSPNVAAPGTETTIVRSGFLLRQEGDNKISVEYIHADKVKDGPVLADLAPIKATFDLSPEGPDDFEITPPNIHPASSDRVRQHLRLITNDPKEAHAAGQLRARFSWKPHPDQAALARHMTAALGSARVAQIEERQADEAYRLFRDAILPGIILLNCKNAVNSEPVEAPTKLNKKRAERGRPPIREHTLITIRLGTATQRHMGGSEAGRRALRASLVRGHFKLRRIADGRMQPLWWSPHARRGYGEPEPRRHIISP